MEAGLAQTAAGTYTPQDAPGPEPKASTSLKHQWSLLPPSAESTSLFLESNFLAES